MNAIARYTNRVSELVLAHADFFQKFLLQNFAGMRVAKLAHARSFVPRNRVPLTRWFGQSSEERLFNFFKSVSDHQANANFRIIGYPVSDWQR